MTKPQNDHVGSDSSFRDSFLEGAARAFFVCSYADFVEQCEEGADLPGASMGADWYNIAPDTNPPNAYALAGELIAGLAALNSSSIYCLAALAEKADGKAPDPEDFGRDFAMQAMGTGVSWFDDHKAFPVKVPNIDCSYFSFSEEAYRGE